MFYLDPGTIKIGVAGLLNEWTGDSVEISTATADILGIREGWFVTRSSLDAIQKHETALLWLNGKFMAMNENRMAAKRAGIKLGAAA